MMSNTSTTTSGSGGGVLTEQILAEKLSKLNNTQHCIETLSHLCIFHRSKAELVVTTWDKQFHISDMAQKVPLLYLANDILQNSKRKGNEFVAEFWKVLPAALKNLVENGDEHMKTIVSRLVDIWEERRVFGSRAKSIKDVMLGKELPQPLEFGKKRFRSIKIIKRDSRSIRTKLTVGGTTERIVSAFHLVDSEHHNEEEEMSKCKSTLQRVRKMEKDVHMSLEIEKDPRRKALAKELAEKENVLKHCIGKLKVVEANRLALVSKLRDALNEQESELENVRTQIQVAQAQTEEVGNMRKRLEDENYVLAADSKSLPVGFTPTPKVTGSQKTAAAIAAEVADRLTASSSSQYIMSSVLSTFAAEEAKNAGLTKTSADSISYSATKKVEQPVSSPDLNVFMPAQSPLPFPANGPYQTVLVSQPQAQYHNRMSNIPNTQQYLHPPGSIMSSYAYGSVPPLPPGPPPPPPSYMMSPMVPLAHQQPPTLSGQQPHPPPNFRPVPPIQPPSGIFFYAQPQHPQ